MNRSDKKKQNKEKEEDPWDYQAEGAGKDVEVNNFNDEDECEEDAKFLRDKQRNQKSQRGGHGKPSANDREEKKEPTRPEQK